MPSLKPIKNDVANRCGGNRGFTILEVVVVIMVLAVLARMSIPAYREYRFRSDLDLAEDQTRQLLHRAQLLAQSSEGDSAWGYHAPSGTIFRGTSYGNRDASFDEMLALPPSVTVSGLQEVVFSVVIGRPSIAGDIIFTGGNGQQRTVSVRSGDTLSAPSRSSSPSSSSSSFLSSFSSKKKRGGGGDDDDDDDD